MPRQSSIGTCSLCGRQFSKMAITRHLAKCQQEQLTKTAASRAKPKKILHLLVEGAWLAYYWMHVEIPADTTLADLDDFLRRTWLECCGHLSAFEIAGQRYTVEPPGEFPWAEDLDEKGFDHVLGDILKPGMKFTHEYDFGTTTNLNLKVIGAREGIAKHRGVQILARNDPPKIMCDLCKKEPATQVCGVCIYNEPAWYCEACAPKHKCYKRGENYFLPVLNSPRVGMCGYTGEAE